jgi:DNA-binding transcriptional ArsR family regulator
MDKKFERQAVFMIEDVETLKVITDPLRLEILELLSQEPHTVKYVADRLGLSSSRLYYHFNLLESKNMISVVDTKTVNNIIEKYYWNTADDFEINNEILTFSNEVEVEDLHRLLAATLDATKEDFMRSLQAKRIHEKDHDQDENENPKEMIAFRLKRRVKEEVYWEYVKELKALVDEFQDLPEVEDSDPDAIVFNVAYFLYPSYYYEEENDDGQTNQK